MSSPEPDLSVLPATVSHDGHGEDVYSAYLNVAAQRQREPDKVPKLAPKWQDQKAARSTPN
jgi:hypothetical protein